MKLADGMNKKTYSILARFTHQEYLIKQSYLVVLLQICYQTGIRCQKLQCYKRQKTVTTVLKFE